MGITSYSFVLAFVPIVVIIWSLLLRIQYHHSTLAILFIIFASLWFIGSYDYRFALIMLGTATSNYYGVKLIKKIRRVFFRKTSAVILAIINLCFIALEIRKLDQGIVLENRTAMEFDFANWH